MTARRQYFTGARRAQPSVPLVESAEPSPPSVADVPAPPVAVDRALDQLTRMHEYTGGKDWFTLDQLCRYLTISRPTYYRLVRAGTWAIPAMFPRLAGAPKFHIDDVAHFIRTSAACHANERLRLQKGAR